MYIDYTSPYPTLIISPILTHLRCAYHHNTLLVASSCIVMKRIPYVGLIFSQQLDLPTRSIECRLKYVEQLGLGTQVAADMVSNGALRIGGGRWPVSQSRWGAANAF